MYPDCRPSFMLAENPRTGNGQLAAIAKIPSFLEDLTLMGWKALTDSGLGALGMCSRLCSLCLIGADGVKGDGLLALAGCHHLQELKLGLCKHAGMQALVDLTNLTTLHFEHSLTICEVASP
ncbi:hypothetical protein WJX84_001432 [Apatococcus fuscideae]|uniref:Uncharacterized protein n=1 Tax=Apatococcus fuscideae TaxID=2026836 RepID=A0AAW1TIX0_9CHLO